MAYNSFIYTLANLCNNLTTCKTMITEQQRCNIHGLSVDDCLLVMRECADRACLVSVREYADITLTPIRTVYDKAKRGLIRSLVVGDRIMVCVNP